MRQMIKWFAVFVLILMLAAAALELPAFVYSVSDEHTLQKKEPLHMEVKRFEKDGSLAGQLYTFALCEKQEEYTMRAVQVEESAAVSDEELTQIVWQELVGMREIELLPEMGMIHKQDLVQRQLYTAYVSVEGGLKARDGVTFWRLSYQGNNGMGEYKLSVILDMEYHKLYSVQLCNEQTNEIYMSYESKISKRKNFKDILEEESWRTAQCIWEYYEFDNTASLMYSQPSIRQYDSNAQILYGEYEVEQSAYQLHCFLSFGDTDAADDMQHLQFIKYYGMDEESGRGYVHIGICSLEKMLQI